MADKEYISGEEYQAISRKSKKTGHQVSVSANLVVYAVVVVVLCLISFAIGNKYGKDHAKAIAPTSSKFGAGGGFGGGGFRNGGGFGQVTSVSSSSITVQNARTGSSTTYTINSNTTITNNGQTVPASDIQNGDTVIVRVASTGSTTATSILVNPNFGGGGGASAGGAGAGGSSTGTGSQTQ